MSLLLRVVNAAGLVVLMLLHILPGTAHEAAQISNADDCDFLARSNDRQYVANYACATAATKLGVELIRNECSDIGALAAQIDRELASERLGGRATNDTRSTLYALFRVFSIDRSTAARQPIFHTLLPNRALLEIPCRSGAYNQSSVFFAYDGTRLPATFRPMTFPRSNGGGTLEVWIRGFDPARGLLVAFRKGRGMGDAGQYALYAIDRKTMNVRLLRAMSKTVWDGRDRFQWNGRYDDEPHGSTWTSELKR